MILAKINIITLFVEFFRSPLKASLLGKAIKKKLLEIEIIALREFGRTSHKKVDDAPYGGGPGMVLMVEPIDKAVSQIKEKTYTILLTPRGERFTQKKVHELFERLSENKSLTLICGHYEGVDQRVSNEIADESISIGDFILSGGEAAALLLVDSIARLIPGFMGNHDSLEKESFCEEGYIEYPQYTWPSVYKNMAVPDVLTHGDHQEIEKWRLKNAKRDGK